MRASTLPDAAQLGDPAPPFRLQSLAGGGVDLTEFAGRLVLLVFWSPTCGWCLKLKPELQTWERSVGGAVPPTVVLTTGSRDVNEGQGFLSPVLFDDGSLVARAYGSTGTPGAILVDAEGAIAAQLAVRGEGVMDLARKGESLLRAASLLAARAFGADGSPAA
ncbi:MAG: TlpA family protein disulfide reductase [Pseudomonadota bacterium]